MAKETLVEPLRQEAKDRAVKRLARAERPEVQPAKQGSGPRCNIPNNLVPAWLSRLPWRSMEWDEPRHGEAEDNPQRHNAAWVRVRK